jgi:hypothetical protein
LAGIRAQALRGRLLQLDRVHTRTEPLAGAGQDDRSHLRRGLSLVQQVEVAVAKLVRPGVEPLGSIQREQQHRPVLLGEYVLVGHVMLLWSTEDLRYAGVKDNGRLIAALTP